MTSVTSQPVLDQPLLEVRGVTKRFGNFVANEAVDLAIGPGRIHALIGENGAGKSTLVKMLYGLLHQDAGEILWQGQPVAIASPRAARALGIGMVSQHFSLFPSMTVLENVALGLDRPPRLAVLAEAIRKVSQAYGLPLDPQRVIADLSVGERQRVEIVRCLLQQPRLIIMDEPTSVLTPTETGQLFETLRQLAREGRSVLFISHKLKEIQALCDDATVLRLGRVVGRFVPAETTLAEMARVMIGADARVVEARESGDKGPIRLMIGYLSLASDRPHGTSLVDISLDVRGGEIVGIAGIAGNGQYEMQQALSGERLATESVGIVIDGTPAGKLGVTERRRLGLASVPEERNGHGSVPSLSLVANTTLTGHHRPECSRRGLLQLVETRRIAQSIIAAFDVRTRGADQPAGTLSGGNLQKFIIGREVRQNPGVLIVAQPTWGVDAAAAATIHEALFTLARAGAAILIISQDLDELLLLSDRIAVLDRGRLSAAMPRATVSLATLGLMMGGSEHHDSDELAVHAG